MTNKTTPIHVTEVYDGELVGPTNPLSVELNDLNTNLRNLLFILANPTYIDKTANAIRNQVQSGTVTTVTTVTNLTNFGTQGADVLYRIESLNTWSNNVRARIS